MPIISSALHLKKKNQCSHSECAHHTAPPRDAGLRKALLMCPGQTWQSNIEPCQSGGSFGDSSETARHAGNYLVETQARADFKNLNIYRLTYSMLVTWEQSDPVNDWELMTWSHTWVFWASNLVLNHRYFHRSSGTSGLHLHCQIASLHSFNLTHV